MNTVKRILKWGVIGLGTLVLLLMLLIAGADRFLSSQRGARWLYRGVEQPMTIQYSSNQVRYLQIGDTSKMPLLLIHGAPGGLFDWLPIASRDQIYKRYYLLIPERPGYGGTHPKIAEPSVIAQSEALVPILDQQSETAVVMGHSYGAPIAVALGGLVPKQIHKIYGVSGAYDPKEEITFSLSYWIDSPFFRYLLPCPIWVANVEKLGHPEALREALPVFESVKVSTTLIHGTADKLVPFNNSTFLMRQLEAKPNLVKLPGQPHPVHVMLPDYFVRLLLGENPMPPSLAE